MSTKAGTKTQAEYDIRNTSDTMIITGHLNLKNTALLYSDLSIRLSEYPETGKIVLKDIKALDSSAVQMLLQVIEENSAHRHIDLHADEKEAKEKISLFGYNDKPDIEKESDTGFFEKIGQQVHDYWRNSVVAFLFLTADIMYWTVVDIFRKDGQRKGTFVQQAIQIGVNSVYIVAPLSFIIGLVLALQSAAQIRNFGANIFIVDLTVIAMMREMGPLITAIILAGRSGSAIAAEISTMKVTSELDALETMALNPVRFVTVPKMHGGLVTVPFLTILADVMGIIGGLLVAYTYLDITPTVFINRMGDALKNRDIIIGIFKSLVFISIVVLTGSFFGFQVKRGAEGVGKMTTKAVVVAITLVIIADSILGLIFY